jgi:transposase InsO family protein
MNEICAYYNITRQAHYAMQMRESQRQSEEEEIVKMVREIRKKHPRMGVRKLQVKLEPKLAAKGLKIGRDRLFELLRKEEMLVERRKKPRRRTTIPGFWRTQNLLPGLTVSRPNQVWVSDITYLETEHQPFVYLFVIMDLYSRQIVGWHVSESLAADGALRALENALQQTTLPVQGLIHHSDHGVQYTCHNYLNTLANYGIRPSMGQVGNCYDNAFAERVIGTLKAEYGLDHSFQNLLMAHLVTLQAIQLYNTDRPHLALNFAVPSDVYQYPSLHVEPIIFPALEISDVTV